jgi:DNA-binding transcriptional ArsR family regulator
MVTTASIAEIASLVGEPARAAMLLEMMDGRALTAKELAEAAGVAAQTASGHLSKLAAAGLVVVRPQGRHRYHRLASGRVAEMLEGLMLVAVDARAAKPGLRVGPRDAALRAARTCYDHIAGRLGVALADSLVEKGHVALDDDTARVTDQGAEFFRELGLEIPAPSRLTCRPCLDWSERRTHLAGRLGAALCKHCLDQGWVRRVRDARALSVTPKGEAAFEKLFGVVGGTPSRPWRLTALP